MKTGRIASRAATEMVSALCDEGIAEGRRREDRRRELTDLHTALADAKATYAVAPRPTSALLDGSAAERRRRREQRRAVTGLVGSLPDQQSTTESDGEAVA
jgi:hypothetical protein